MAASNGPDRKTVGSREPGTVLWWVRHDLRLTDNPALQAARETGGQVVPVFILDEAAAGAWARGAASRWWLHHSLAAMAASLERAGSRLVLRNGDTVAELIDLVRLTKAGLVVWNGRYEPAAIRVERLVVRAMDELNVTCMVHHGNRLFAPGYIRRRDGAPYRVFTPFWKAAGALPPPVKPLPAPRRIPAPGRWPQGDSLHTLRLDPRADWSRGIGDHWNPGEQGARTLLRRFCRESAGEYGIMRDRPDGGGTSHLSPHLHFGEISPRQVWWAVADTSTGGGSPADPFLRQLGWREFAGHLLDHFPHTPDEPLRAEFTRFPWREDDNALRAWQRGQTGFPIVDAGMRELWATGWMHNRVRMIAASFLIKDLRISWQTGARWFWDTLVDADMANNTLGWQWVAGCGADAAPYFRIFNPVRQGERFDLAGAYVRKWVPELARLPGEWIHRPWDAPQGVLTDAGVTLGKDYPKPVVDHDDARRRALAAFQTITSGNRP